MPCATPSTNVIKHGVIALLTTSQTKLTMTIDGVDYTGTISRRGRGKYSYTVTVGGGELIIESVSIKVGRMAEAEA